MGKLTPELRGAIEAAATLQQVEDLYLPYKPKRRTRAMIARERGLEPLADLMAAQEVGVSVEALARRYLSSEVLTVEDALAGARDIVAEQVNEDAVWATAASSRAQPGCTATPVGALHGRLCAPAIGQIDTCPGTPGSGS